MESDTTRQREDLADADALSPSSQVHGRLAQIPEALEPLGKPFYAVAILLIILPALDFWGTVAPMQWGEVRWRFGALGIFSGFLLTPLFGSVLMMAMAAMMEHRRVQLLASMMNASIALVTFAMFTLFGLDALQIRSQLPAESIRAFDFVALRTLGKLFVGASVFAWLSLAGLRSYRKTRLPEGWQPGDPVPIVNTDTVNLEGLTTDAPQGERASREMLIAAEDFPTEKNAAARPEALRPDMLMRPDEIHQNLPATAGAPARKSEDLLLRPSKPSVPAPPDPEKEGVPRDMLIGRKDEPKK